MIKYNGQAIGDQDQDQINQSIDIIECNCNGQTFHLATEFNGQAQGAE
jgi:hypothetical protein